MNQLGWPGFLVLLAACGSSTEQHDAATGSEISHTCSCLVPGCPAAECVPGVVADGLGAVGSLAADGPNYFVTTTNTVYMTTTARSGMPVMLATAQAQPRSVKVLVRGQTREIYWANQGTGEIMRVVIAADGARGTATAIVTDAAGVFAIDVVPTSVFWTNINTGDVRQLTLDVDGTPMQQRVVATGQSKPAWLQCNGIGGVFWTNTSSGAIVSATFDTGNGMWAAKPVFSGLVAPSEIDLDTKGLYFLSDGGTSVMMATRNTVGFDSPVPLVSNQVGLAGLLCDENSLDWANGAGEIIAAPRAASGLPGSPAPIASGQAGTVGLAFAETVHIGWINPSNGGVIVELTQ